MSVRERLGSLRVRLTITVAILSTVGLAAGAALLTRGVETTVIRAIDDHGRDELRRVGMQIAHGVPLKEIRGGTPSRTLSFVRPDGSRVDVSELRETTEGGDVRLHAVRVERGAVVDGPPPAVLMPRPVPPPGVMWSVVEQPMLSPHDGPVRAFAFSPLEDVRHSTRVLQHVLKLGLPVLVLVLSFAAWLLVGRALQPVRAMTQHASGIADATAPERLAVPPTAELRELAHTLNAMLDRLAGAAHRQREFVSDASHELRSPIAATRALVEVGLAHPDRVGADVVLRGVLAETTRLEALVADLLALARLDEQSALPHAELDLDDVVLEDAVRARAVAVDTRGITAVKICGDRKSLGHLVRNLLDNAARHATSRVEVSTLIDERGAVLCVDDDGPGIPEADRARVFERFTRLSSSRSRDDGGAGLGLALVRRIAEQHGATARIDRSPLGGARLEVRFPAIRTCD